MKLKELFSDPKRWSKRVSARDVDGRPINYTSAEAFSFCIAAAVNICYSRVDAPGIRSRIDKHVGVSNLTGWNDAPERTIEDIQKLCNELDI